MTQYIDIKSKNIKIGGLPINLHLFYIALCFMIPWTIYLKTNCPTVTVGDNGELIAAPYVLGIPHPTGYPTFCILGKMFTMIFPFGSAGIRMNLTPSLYASIAAIFIYLLLFEIFKNMELAVISTLLFSFTRIFWSQSISAEVYSLNILFYAAWLFYLLRWFKTHDTRNFYSFAFFCLMGFTNHLTTILAGPGLLYIGIIYFKKFFKFKHIVVISCLTILLFTSYWYLPMRSAVSKAEIMSSLLWGDQTRINDFKRHLSGSTFHGLMFKQDFRQVFNNFKTYLDTLNWDFTPPIMVILIIGIISFFRKYKKLFIFTFLIFSTDILFSINYKIEDINVFYLPSFLIALIWITAGFKYLLGKKNKWAVFLIPFLIIIPF
ncbi:DUF2723 domain-containing protein, partial [bacterium]|nr:DUF2723 domain-containing protein [bacterium]